MAKKIEAYIKLQVPPDRRTQSARWPRAGSAWREHHGILQGVQCADAGHGAGHACSGRDHGLQRPQLHVHQQNPAGLRSSEEGRRHQKGSGVPNTDKVGKVTRAQLEEIAKTKEPDLTAADLDAAVRTIAGSARSMGIKTEGV